MLLGWMAMYNMCEQCEKDGKVYVEKFEEVSEVLNTSPKVKMWSFLKTATHFFALQAAAPLFCAHRSCRRLHGVVAIFWFSVIIFGPVS